MLPFKWNITIPVTFWVVLFFRDQITIIDPARYTDRGVSVRSYSYN